jgi:hypothetical protein
MANGYAAILGQRQTIGTRQPASVKRHQELILWRHEESTHKPDGTDWLRRLVCYFLCVRPQR